MAELHKRSSPLERDKQSQSAKKLRKEAISSSSCVAMQERQEERGEGEVSSGSGAAMVAVETMDEPQLHLTFGLSMFHCRACRRPLKPPTFKCVAGHVVCGACRGSHGRECDRAAAAAAFVASPDVDSFVRGGKLACRFEEFGCESRHAYFEADGHERACRWAPCRCPDPGCDVATSPARLLDHVAARHCWPVTEVAYGKRSSLAMPAPPRGLHFVVGSEDRSVFLVSVSAPGPGSAAGATVSLVCVRANGDAAAGAPQFTCTLWVANPRGKGNFGAVRFAVPSSDLSGGFAAVEQDIVLGVSPKMLPGPATATANTLTITLLIDRAPPAAAAAAAAANLRSPPS